MADVARDDSTRRLIQRVLNEAFPEECAAVGDENVADIAAGARFDDGGGGARNIVFEVIHLLASAATVAALYLQWRSSRPTGDDHRRLDERIARELVEARRLETAKRLEIYRLLDRLTDDDQ